MIYPIKRVGITLLNLFTMLLWDLLLFIMTILSTIAYSNIKNLNDEINSVKSSNVNDSGIQGIIRLNLVLIIMLWIFFFIFIPLTYLGQANPYNNGAILSFAILLSIFILIVSIISLVALNNQNLTNDQSKTAKSCYVGMIIISVFVIVAYGIYVPISIYKYKKSGGLTKDIQNAFSSLLLK